MEADSYSVGANCFWNIWLREILHLIIVLIIKCVDCVSFRQKVYLFFLDLIKIKGKEKQSQCSYISYIYCLSTGQSISWVVTRRPDLSADCSAEYTCQNADSVFKCSANLLLQLLHHCLVCNPCISSSCNSVFIIFILCTYCQLRGFFLCCYTHVTNWLNFQSKNRREN